MLDRATLERRFSLNPPATSAAVTAANAQVGYPFPEDYLSFLALSNGLSTEGRLMLLAAGDVADRNRDYEVQEYLPGYVMIGDDGGGVALLMKDQERTVFEVGMGSMDEETMQQSADSLEQLLVEFGGLTLAERR